MKKLSDSDLDVLHVSVRDVIELREDERARHEAELRELRDLCAEQQRLLNEQHALLVDYTYGGERELAHPIH
jgi:hypothetical protein